MWTSWPWKLQKVNNNHPFLILLAELSLAAVLIEPFDPTTVVDVRYYANREGVLTPVIAGSLPQPRFNRTYLLGVNINGCLHPIFDNRRRWIFVNNRNGHIVIVSPQLYHRYGHRYPTNIISQLEIHNNREFVMPRRPRNGSPNLPANGPQGRN